MSDPHPPFRRPELTEDQLRARLHRAVAAVEPEPGALPRLRTAVPRRRAARRRALSGAAVLAAAVAVLPVVHATQPFHLSGDATGGPAAPGDHSSPPSSADGRTGRPHSGSGGTLGGVGGTGSEPTGRPSASGSPGASPAVAPACARTDLGRAEAQLAAAEPVGGRLYGWFQLTNTGDHACRVAGPGQLAPGAGATGVQVLAHTVGDPAGSLTDPATLPRELLLGPGGSYVVRFAWVPTRCGAASDQPTGASGEPTPAPSAAEQPAAADAAPGPTPAAAVAADPSPSASPSPSGTAAADFTLGYSPDPPAGPAATTALPAGCGGTVYFTGPEPAPLPAGVAPTASAAP
ncbi:hypothetical protein [Streptomyces sp. TLI_171]|uniref:hypothetical protein n=1 Tax=Streptomyces sp. TLI_171 TaxID=1938859 RepID=UPI000C1A31DB|nr:hypothetical protein [Streptomyces sp. TLI_171]RKE20017.1 hypothetical protein BX266_3354 [Streptomyces sp. TLI_171]